VLLPPHAVTNAAPDIIADRFKTSRRVSLVDIGVFSSRRNRRELIRL
jgi:hypothetical protein